MICSGKNDKKTEQDRILRRCRHGGAHAENIKYDFSVSLNPLGMPAAAIRVLNADRNAFRDYPDTECSLLRKALAEKLSVSSEQIVCGAGAADLIYRIPSALGLKKVLLAIPAFAEYERALRMQKTQIHCLRTSPESGFALVDEFLSAGSGFDAIIISNPVNPSGRIMEPESWERLLQWCAETKTLLIADECFMDFVSDEKREQLKTISQMVPGAEKILIRSFTKIYAMAGLRIGYAVFDDPVKAETTRLYGPPWNVSAPAQRAVLAALTEDQLFLRKTLDYVERERWKLVGRLRSFGMKVWDSDANYVLMEAEETLGQGLAAEGFFIRDCSDYQGLPSAPGKKIYRIGLRSDRENGLLLKAMAELLEKAVPEPRPEPGSIMVQGTMSNAGKSLIVAGLCRIFAQDGYHPAPFKSQNMALNSYITADGKEIGRAQAVQAEAAGIPPVSDMNPVLLKPTTEKGSQVIVNGEARCNMSAVEYFEYRKSLGGEIMDAYHRLGQEHDIIVIEGAGSPVEINLTENREDFVNMGLAEMTDSPVLMVGDIDRGGIFAQLGGTMMLLDDPERERVRGVIVNKFRGDISLFARGRELLREVCGIPVVGVVPYIDIDIDDEDSLSHRLSGGRKQLSLPELRICVVRLPRISNFSDMTALDTVRGVRVDYVDHPEALISADAVILPGSKSTIEDLLWMRENGLADAVVEAAERGIAVTGICGGYQMLGMRILDTGSVESRELETDGLGLLPVHTEFESRKVTRQTDARTSSDPGMPEELRSRVIRGYEIHMGRSRILEENASPFSILENGEPDGCIANNVFGTYLHGLFDSRDFTMAYCQWVASLRGRKVSFEMEDYTEYREAQYDILADALRESLDMKYIYEIMGLGENSGKAERKR